MTEIEKAIEYLEPISNHPTMTGEYCEHLKTALVALKEKAEREKVQVYKIKKTDEIKPCPFCGGKGELQHNLEIYRVMCTQCGAMGQTADDWHEGDNAVEGAVEAWNRRAEPASYRQVKIDAVPVVRGEWVDGPTGDDTTCSNCHEDWNVYDNDTYRFAFCPNCGAKMEAEQ